MPFIFQTQVPRTSGLCTSKLVRSIIREYSPALVWPYVDVAPPPCVDDTVYPVSIKQYAHQNPANRSKSAIPSGHRCSILPYVCSSSMS
jgi:hypothetical protein